MVIQKMGNATKEKLHKCYDCGRPIRHRGYCLNDNIRRKILREERERIEKLNEIKE